MEVLISVPTHLWSSTALKKFPFQRIIGLLPPPTLIGMGVVRAKAPLSKALTLSLSLCSGLTEQEGDRTLRLAGQTSQF